MDYKVGDILLCDSPNSYPYIKFGRRHKKFKFKAEILEIICSNYAPNEVLRFSVKPITNTKYFIADYLEGILITERSILEFARSKEQEKEINIFHEWLKN